MISRFPLIRSGMSARITPPDIGPGAVTDADDLIRGLFLCVDAANAVAGQHRGFAQATWCAGGVRLVVGLDGALAKDLLGLITSNWIRDSGRKRGASFHGLHGASLAALTLSRAYLALPILPVKV